MPRAISCLASAAVFFLSAVGAGYGASPANQRFVVLDALLYQHKPNLSAFGMRPLIQINQPQAMTDEVDEAMTRQSIAVVKDFDGAVFLDYEGWPLSGEPAQVIAGNVAKFIRVADIAHQSAPKATFGFYGLMPCREYWGLVKNDRKKIDDWKECSRQGEAIANHVEVIFPSLYTFYNDQKSWDIYARGMMEEARRYNKPVYVFLWPEFHVSNRLLSGTEIPAKFWRHELDFCRGLADGIVIWGGWQEQWRDDAPWWIETKAFLASLIPP
jgi:hypothetical protein